MRKNGGCAGIADYATVSQGLWAASNGRRGEQLAVTSRADGNGVKWSADVC